MSTIRRLFKKTARAGQTTLAAFATVGMVVMFTPTIGQANGLQNLSSNLSSVAQGGSSSIQDVQVRGRGFRGGGRGFRGGGRSFRGSRGFRGRGFRNRGFFIGSGIVAGTIIGSKLHHKHKSSGFSAHYIAACSRKYKSFNPNTGYYLAYSGKYRKCKL